MSGAIRVCRGVRVYWKLADCRYSGARRGIGGIRGHWGVPRSRGGHFGGLGGIRGCQGCIEGLAGTVGTQG